MAKYTLDSIMCGEKYNIESDVFIDVYKMAEQGMKVREIKEQINTLYVKHALLTAKKMHNEGDWFDIEESMTEVISSGFNDN